MLFHQQPELRFPLYEPVPESLWYPHDFYFELHFYAFERIYWFNCVYWSIRKLEWSNKKTFYKLQWIQNFVLNIIFVYYICTYLYLYINIAFGLFKQLRLILIHFSRIGWRYLQVFKEYCSPLQKLQFPSLEIIGGLNHVANVSFEYVLKIIDSIEIRTCWSIHILYCFSFKHVLYMKFSTSFYINPLIVL